MKYLEDGPMTFAGGFGPGPLREFCPTCDLRPAWCECPEGHRADCRRTHETYDPGCPGCMTRQEQEAAIRRRFFAKP